MKKHIHFLIATLLSSFATAQAESGLSYTYIGAQLTSADTEILGTTYDADGFGIGGSIAATDHIAVSFFSSTTEVDTLSVDQDTYGVGATFHTPIDAQTDFLAGVSLINVDISGPGGSVDDNGNMISVGLRSQVSSSIELNGGLSRMDAFDTSSTAFNLGSRIGDPKGWQLTLGFAHDNDDGTNVYSLGAGSNF